MLLSTLLALPLAVQPQSERGEFLYHQCQATSLLEPTPAEVDSGHTCMAYFEGFIDGQGPQQKYGCMAGRTYKELAEYYVKYMDKNHAYWEQSKRLGAEAAMMRFCWPQKQK
jgi:hypothetical protein